MAINLISKYIPYLDEVFKMNSLTSILDTPEDLVRATADAKTVLIPKISMDGLGDYDNGFPDGDVSLAWVSHTFRYDRGRAFQIDRMENQESAGLAFARLASEFVRTKVAPEVDAVRFSEYATNTGYTVTGAALTDKTAVAAVDAGIEAMKDAEVDLTGGILYVTPQVKGMIKRSDLFTRTLAPGQNPDRPVEIFDMLRVIEVPQARFYKGIDLLDGKTSGKEAGGYQKKSNTGVDINFLIVARGAVTQITKRASARIFDADVNQSADAYKVDYRLYHDAWINDNKKVGVYAHCKA